MPGLLASPHPAPVPEPPSYPGVNPSELPGKLCLKGTKIPPYLGGVVLKWDKRTPAPVEFSKYEIFYYRETDAIPDPSLWQKMGDVNVGHLPVAIFINSLPENAQYYFTVRAVDSHNRRGPFSDPVSILY